MKRGTLFLLFVNYALQTLNLLRPFDSKKCMQTILDRFDPIELSQMKGIRLMNRIDTKYVTTLETLRRFLIMAEEHYYVQDFHGRRMMPYHTIYLDTPDQRMYHDHQRGKKHRYKVRMRMYENDMVSFLEVKNKSNKGRTKKKRTEIEDLTAPPAVIADEGNGSIEERRAMAMGYLQELVPYDAEELIPTIENRFRRITLVNKAKTERLTIDMEISFHNILTGNDVSLPDHVIIELKRDGLIPSPATELLRQLRIKKMGFSKMAIGTALTSPELKQNLFKQRIHQIFKMTDKPATAINK